MARLSSRELALERRKALTTSGKKSSVAAAGTANRVRTAADARKTRTNANSDEPAAPVVTTPPVAAAPQRTVSLTTAAPSRTSQVKPQRHPSRDLVLLAVKPCPAAARPPTPVAIATALMLPVRLRPPHRLPPPLKRRSPAAAVASVPLRRFS